MGVYGCAWVRWGAEVMGRHTNKASRHKNGCAGHDLGPMAGEISPNIMFCKKTGKNARMTLDGCAWVCMGAVGCIHVEGSKNERKSGANGREGQY